MIGLGTGLGFPYLSQSYDGDALAFFARAGITNSTQKRAVDTLVRGLKTFGLWSKIYGLYPFVGGTSATHAFNLKSALYPITWVNGPTHGANGVTGNGTTQYGVLTGTEGVLPALGHLSVYVHTAASTAGDFRDYMGFGNEGGSARYYLIQSIDNTSVNYWGTAGNAISAVAGAAPTGLLSTHRRTTTEHVGYLNASAEVTSAVLEVTPMPTVSPLGLLCRIDDVVNPLEFSNATFALASFGLAMTHAEIGNFYTLVQAFQTTLGRQV
jgi:hypothetical protein